MKYLPVISDISTINSSDNCSNSSSAVSCCDCKRSLLLTVAAHHFCTVQWSQWQQCAWSYAVTLRSTCAVAALLHHALALYCIALTASVSVQLMYTFLQLHHNTNLCPCTILLQCAVVLMNRGAHSASWQVHWPAWHLLECCQSTATRIASLQSEARHRMGRQHCTNSTRKQQ